MVIGSATVIAILLPNVYDSKKSIPKVLNDLSSLSYQGNLVSAFSLFILFIVTPKPLYSEFLVKLCDLKVARVA